MGDVDGDARLVAGGEEARLADGGDDRIAHEEIDVGLADAGLGPGDHHDLQRAVEVRQVERHGGVPVRVRGDDAGEQGNELVHRRGRNGGRAGVAA